MAVCSEVIDVESEGEPRRPVRFTWRGEMILLSR